MDFFQVTDIWSEKINGHIGMKVRFEKINVSKKSWWAIKGSANPVPHGARDFNICPELTVCETCEGKSPRIFKEGWMCLSPNCGQFWQMDGLEVPQDLTYDEAFLNKRELPKAGIQYPFLLKPNLLVDLLREEAVPLTRRDNWRGVVCPLCGKCVPSMFWNGWNCSWKTDIQHTIPCKWTYLFNITPVSLQSLTSTGREDTASMSNYRLTEYESTTFHHKVTDYMSCKPYVKVSYVLPDIGSVTHYKSNRYINEQPKGPDDTFSSLQNSNLGLRRYLHQTQVGETATAHFAQNYGMHYKFAVAVESKDFSETPDCVIQSLGRLAWATKDIMGDYGEHAIKTWLPNELILIGYFEGMKMGYHDDGEKDLGPIIATFSVGGSPKMTLRMKAKYYHGETSSSLITKGDPVLKGCRLEEERRALKEELDKGVKDQAAYKESLNALFREKPKKATGMAPVALSMNLQHGDMVVMHSVVPDKNSILRYAITARHFKTATAAEADLQKSQFQLTTNQVYDGQ
ncbi:hypothetical protein N7478_007740 [Penicillium angulare]|uniref:uncharacterized protein n=1 Tax=Penicillium angulare TaxID=116970 RepID=UPI002540191A|nr:uncharacterized protein N7478_007740 [Penicillium angulare]KAJ5272615.1 hypothetical protein N7478_007740 [Penicillium angulare]